MSSFRSFWKKPTETFEIVLAEDVNWIRIALLFSCNGFVLIFYLAKASGRIAVGDAVSTFATISTILSLGIVYGLFYGFTIGLLMKLPGIILNAENNLKKIYIALAWSSLPFVISIPFILVNIMASGLILTDIDTISMLFLLALILISKIAYGLLEIWHVVLLFKGLKVAQNLNSSSTILNYLSVTIAYGLFYYFVIGSKLF